MSQEFVAVQLSQASRNVEKSKPTGVAAKVKIGAAEVIVYHGMGSYLIRTILKDLQSNVDRLLKISKKHQLRYTE